MQTSCLGPIGRHGQLVHIPRALCDIVQYRLSFNLEWSQNRSHAVRDLPLMIPGYSILYKFNDMCIELGHRH